MNAIVFDSQLKFMRDYPLARVPEGESLVRVLRAGICNTDLEITRGYMNYRGVLGHEFVGIAESGAMKNHASSARSTRTMAPVQPACAAT